MRRLTILIIVIASGLFLAACHEHSLVTTSITIEGNGSGRVFDGLGALSAGASSRLLIDYPEPYRSQILDYLFKPGYGASLQHLKVEIGSDVNSTDGSEPSFARTRAELTHPNFNRGYEWWLMEEAKKRNPHIIFDSLAWGAPGWIGNGHFYSQDMANYVAKFIQGAKSRQLDMPYTGIWNETPYEPSYVKLLKKTLLGHGLPTRVVCCDLYTGEHPWSIVDKMESDPVLEKAVDVVGVHSPNVLKGPTAPDSARKSGKPLWASEDEFFYYTNGLSKGWSPFAESLAMIYNLNYIEDRITATEIWSPVTSYYDNLPAPRSGLMLANTPWSGHYQVNPTIWVTAHTTQFAQPGWQYIDSACGLLKGGGSFVTLKSPSGRNYSVIVETVKAQAPQRVTFRVTGGLSQGTVHVWETNARKTFDHVSDLVLANGSFSISLDPDSVYSLSTTTGQGKGTAAPPPPAPFPIPYAENFEHTPSGQSPRYFADQDGAFEVWPCTKRPGRCLFQVITRMPIPWDGLTPDPFTMLGNTSWKDYEVSSDVMLAGSGDVTLLGRIDSANFFADHHAHWPSAYILLINQTGAWKLLSAGYKRPTVTLASGRTSFSLNTWRHLALKFNGSNIRAMIDGAQVANVQDTTHKSGMAAIGSGWNKAEFDNFAVRPE
ncbi:MAG: galactosylceramidase [Acidobacteriota bacterium]|nr:galactosylceramidase [Acidobacteriota bacterium]